MIFSFLSRVVLSFLWRVLCIVIPSETALRVRGDLSGFVFVLCGNEEGLADGEESSEFLRVIVSDWLSPSDSSSLVLSLSFLLLFFSLILPDEEEEPNSFPASLLSD